MSSDTGVKSAQDLNLQARFEQLEGAISEAHGVVDQMTPRDDQAGDEKAPEAGTASATGLRCQVSLVHLISRLQTLRDQVGQV